MHKVPHQRTNFTGRCHGNQQNLAENETTSVEMNRCTAYDVITLARQKVTMEANPAYEQVTTVPQ